MEITPHIGIGDIMIIKMIALHYDLTIIKININDSIVKKYCGDYEKKTKFLRNFIEFLFTSTIVEINNKTPDFNYIIKHYPPKRIYLYPYLAKPSLNSIPYNDYICIHTKLRHDRLIDKTYSEIVPKLINFLQIFKTSKTIIITGEKKIGVNFETSVLKTKSLYNELLFLKNNNNIIDLTYDELTEGNEDFDAFKNDIELINKSCCNITFGIGGPFVLCSAFSNNHIAFIQFLDLSPHKEAALILSNNICQTVENLANRINMI